MNSFLLVAQDLSIIYISKHCYLFDHLPRSCKICFRYNFSLLKINHGILKVQNRNCPFGLHTILCVMDRIILASKENKAFAGHRQVLPSKNRFNQN